MSRTPQPRRVRHVHAPRAHRAAMTARLPSQLRGYARRAASHAHGNPATSVRRECADAQTIFFVARGIAALLAAVAVGLSAGSDEAERSATAPPASPHATVR